MIKIITNLNAFLTVDLENYSDLQNFIENHIAEKQKEINAKYDKIDEIEDAEKWHNETTKLEDELGSEVYYFEQEFPNRTRYSLIVQTHSILEVYLKRYCDNLKRINNNPIGISDLKGNSDLEKAKLYLKKVHNINFSNLQPEWNFLSNMRKIRNQIIHNNGKFKLKDEGIIRIINEISELGRMWENIEPKMKENEEYEIEIKSKLNKIYIKNVINFFDKLGNELKTA